MLYSFRTRSFVWTNHFFHNPECSTPLPRDPVPLSGWGRPTEQAQAARDAGGDPDPSQPAAYSVTCDPSSPFPFPPPNIHCGRSCRTNPAAGPLDGAISAGFVWSVRGHGSSGHLRRGRGPRDRSHMTVSLTPVFVSPGTSPPWSTEPGRVGVLPTPPLSPRGLQKET